MTLPNREKQLATAAFFVVLVVSLVTFWSVAAYVVGHLIVKYW